MGPMRDCFTTVGRATTSPFSENSFLFFWIGWLVGRLVCSVVGSFMFIVCFFFFFVGFRKANDLEPRDAARLSSSGPPAGSILVSVAPLTFQSYAIKFKFEYVEKMPT